MLDLQEAGVKAKGRKPLSSGVVDANHWR